jgi:hypothetical protein
VEVGKLPESREARLSNTSLTLAAVLADVSTNSMPALRGVADMQSVGGGKGWQLEQVPGGRGCVEVGMERGPAK